MKEKKHILVVDDHACVLEGLKAAIHGLNHEVAVAESLEKAMIHTMSGGDVDILVVDMTLKTDGDGLRFAEDLKARGLIPAFILFTMHDELWNISLIEEANPDGVVFKGDDLSELLAAVETVAEGKRFRSSSYLDKLILASGNKSLLTEVDKEVLRLIGNGDTSREIAVKMNVSTKSVEYHRTNIMRKLSSRTIPEAIRKAVRLGIMYVAAIMAGHGIAGAAEPAPEAIDLGLSVLWADRNLGAGAHGEAGGYFCYGETSVKEKYDWDTYTHCDSEIGTAHDLGTDNIAGSGLDAAHAVLGDGWRLPTDDEYKELVANCTLLSSMSGDMYCVMFRAADGAEILLPECGYMSGTRVVHENTTGVYLTANSEYSCEYIEDEDLIWADISPVYFALSKDDVMTSMIGSAQLGYSVRPVRDRNHSGTNPPKTADGEKNAVIYDLNGRVVAAGDLAPGFYLRHNADNTVSRFVVR